MREHRKLHPMEEARDPAGADGVGEPARRLPKATPRLPEELSPATQAAAKPKLCPSYPCCYVCSSDYGMRVLLFDH